MITADPKSRLGYLCRKVAEMKPGQRLEISRYELADIPSFVLNDADFTPAHRILENIVGSAYTHSFSVRPDNGNVVFARHEETGERHYSSPDDDFRRARSEERRRFHSLSRNEDTTAVRPK